MTKALPLRTVIAANVRALRKQLKETQPQIAERAKARGYVLDQGTVSRVENKRLVPSIDVLEALAHGLDVEAWQLLVPAIDPKNPPVLRDATASERELWKRLRENARALGLET